MKRFAYFALLTIFLPALVTSLRAAAPGPTQPGNPRAARGPGVAPPAARGRGVPIPGAPQAAKDPATQFYDAIVADYMAGKWDNLAPRLEDPNQVAALSADQKADVAYIKAAMAECRPDWWEKAKAGKPATFQVTVWDKQFVVHFKPSDKVMEPVAKGDGSYDEAWQSDMMDNSRPLQTTAGPSRDFTEANGVNGLLWGALEDTRLRLVAVQQKIPPVPADKRTKFNYYTRFRMHLAAAYHGKPRDRAYEMYQAATAWRGRNGAVDEYFGRVPIALAVQLSMMVDPKSFKSFGYVASGPPGLLIPSGHINTFVLDTLSESIRFTYSLAGDKALREAIKAIAAANDDQRLVTGTGMLSLPAGQTFNLDLKAQDEADAALWTWEGYFMQFNGLNLRAPRAPRRDTVVTLDQAPPARGGLQPALSPPEDFFGRASALYMSGDWDKLDDLLKTAPAADSLSAPQKEAIAYIRKAIADGRPEWLATLKPGGSIPLKISMWGQSFNATFNEKKHFEFIERKAPELSWPLDRPADKAPLDEAGNVSFTREQHSDATIWQMAEAARIVAGWPGKMPTSGDAVERSGGYMLFRENLTAAYYAKPRDRAWLYYTALDSIESPNQKIPHYAALSPLALSLLLDMVRNPKHYPSFHVRPRGGVDRGQTVDLGIVNNYFQLTARDFDTFEYTFEEDKVLREMAKKLADDNSDAAAIMKAAAVKLPDGTMLSLWPRKDENDPIYSTLAKELKEGPLAGIQFRAPPMPRGATP